MGRTTHLLAIFNLGLDGHQRCARMPSPNVAILELGVGSGLAQCLCPGPVLRCTGRSLHYGNLLHSPPHLSRAEALVATHRTATTRKRLGRMMRG